MKKLVNEKGKLFGIINIVDLIVILVVLAVVIGVCWKLFGSNISEAVSSAVEMTYEVKVTGVEAEDRDDIERYVPENLVSNGSTLGAKLVSAEITPHVEAHYGENGLEYVENEEYIDIIFTIEASVSAASVKNDVGSQEVRVGKEHIVKTEHLEFTGNVISIEKK